MNKTCCLFSLLLIVSFALPTVAEPVVIGETSTIQSEILDEQRGLMVHLPDGYETSQASYPVVYLLDARSNFHHTTGTIKALSRVGHVPEMIVVAIMNTERTRDLTATADSPDEETGEVEMPTAGGADNCPARHQRVADSPRREDLSHRSVQDPDRSLLRWLVRNSRTRGEPQHIRRLHRDQPELALGRRRAGGKSGGRVR